MYTAVIAAAFWQQLQQPPAYVSTGCYHFAFHMEVRLTDTSQPKLYCSLEQPMRLRMSSALPTMAKTCSAIAAHHLKLCGSCCGFGSRSSSSAKRRNSRKQQQQLLTKRRLAAIHRQ
jgi:hypothetical protein